MLASVYSYRVTVKSVSSCCVRVSRVLSNPVTYEITSDIERFIQSIISALPTAKDNLDSYHIAQRDDNNYMLKTYRIL